jgi:hypothetical protein
MTEQLLNSVSSSLLLAIGPADTSATLQSSSFPSVSGGTYRAIIDSELVRITDVDEATITIERGCESTTAVSHSANASVIVIATAGGIMQTIEDYALQRSEITGAASTIVENDLATSKALVSNGEGKVAVSSVTAAELGYVAGVTSAIQTQLNDRATDAELTAVAGDIRDEFAAADDAIVDSLADVATSGSYEDLSDLPTLGTSADNAETDFISVAPTDTGRNVIAAQNAGAIPLTLRAAGSQSANLLTVQNENLSTVAGIDQAGRVFTPQLRTELTPSAVTTLYILFPNGNSGNVVEVVATSGGGNYFTIASGGAITGIYFTALEASIAAKLVAANNLSDLTNVTNARSNLGLGTMALNDNASYYTTTQVDGFFVTTNGAVTVVAAAAAAAQSTADSATTTANSASSAASSAAASAATAVSDAATALATANAAQSTANAAATPGAVTAEISAAVASVTALIPTNNSSLTNGAGYITSASIPTTVSSFTNDSGYITASGSVADGTYTVGLGMTQNGTITISGGKITAIQQAS